MTINKQSNGHVISNYCFICGYDHKEPIEALDFCHCCGDTIGYWSINPYPEDVISYRDDWFKHRNCKFDVSRNKPKVWNKELAIAQIKKNVPEEFWNNDPNVTKKPAIIVKPQEPAENVTIDTQKNSSIFKTLYTLIKKVFLKH